MTFSGSCYSAQRAVQQLQLETSNSFPHKTKYFVQFTIEVKILKGKQFRLDTSNLVSYPKKCAVFLMVNWSLMSAVFSIRLQKPKVLKQKAQILHNKISMQNNFLNFAFYLMLPISNLLLIGGAILITRALYSLAPTHSYLLAFIQSLKGLRATSPLVQVQILNCSF